jgi:crotonobetainyl-CoA:carnitine CoA-transferase CaiB-like acyl-CoA transferase
VNALQGLLVVDLSRVLAGPYCTMILGDLGARVIKIENPVSGDDTRAWGPPFLGGESAYFLSVNRNKESLTLNLKHPAGKEALWRLIEMADVLVENFRPGTLERLGFGYEACAVRRPELVYASISGYGATGPESSRPGYDLIAQGEGGVMSLTGDSGGPPFKTGVSQADIVAGMWAISGITTALFMRERTGHGQRVDAALLDGQVGLLGYQAANYFATGEIPHRKGNRHPTITPYETYATSDGYLNVAVGTEAQWHTFCRIVGHPELAAHPRFATNADRIAHRSELETLVQPLMTEKTTSAWIVRFHAADVPAGPVRTVEETLNSPQVKARDMIIAVDHPSAGPLRLTGTPVKLSASPPPPGGHRPPPRLGEHTESVLGGLLGYSREAIDSMKKGGAI